MSDAPPPMTILQQARFLSDLCARGLMSDNEMVGSLMTELTREDLMKIGAIAQRLNRMSPHEDAIRAMVMGRVE